MKIFSSSTVDYLKVKFLEVYSHSFASLHIKPACHDAVSFTAVAQTMQWNINVDYFGHLSALCVELKFIRGKSVVSGVKNSRNFTLYDNY